MKDSEFIELLNLYLDHEITAGDAARLEAEVQGNPSRRRVYQDYCRMQKACKLVAQDFAAPASPAERKVVAFEATHAGGNRRAAWFGAAGLAAAAAFAAVIFVHRSHNEAVATAPANAVVQTTPPLQTMPVQQSVQVVAAQQPAVPMPVTNDALSLRHVPEQRDALALTAQNDPHFAWMQQVQLRPLQMPSPADQLHFELTPTLQPQNRTYSSGKQPLPSDVPWIAIRFQK